MEPSSCAGINSPCRIIALIAITLNLGDLDRHKIRRIVHQCLSGLIRFILHSCCSFSLVNRVSTIAYFDLKVKPLFSLARSEEHTSELQTLLRISYDVFCLQKKQTTEKMKKVVLIMKRYT